MSRYEQFDTSLEMIEQELRYVVCEQRRTYMHTDVRRIIVFYRLSYFVCGAAYEHAQDRYQTPRAYRVKGVSSYTWAINHHLAKYGQTKYSRFTKL